MQGDTPAVIPGEDGERLVPSVVAFDRSDGRCGGQCGAGDAADGRGERGVFGQAADGAGRRGCAGGAEAVSVQAGGGVAAGRRAEAGGGWVDADSAGDFGVCAACS